MLPSPTIRCALASGAVFLGCLPVSGVLVFSVLSYLFTCPPQHPACDLPDMAAFGLALVLAPILSLAGGIYAFRQLTRKGEAAAAKSSAAGSH